MPQSVRSAVDGRVSVLVALCVFMFAGVSARTILSAQSSIRPAEEWDAVEIGLVELAARGNAALKQPPMMQIVSPPVVLDSSSAKAMQRSLVQLADQIPQWGPYFRPSGRSLRKEFAAFVDSLEGPIPWPGGTQPPILDDESAFRFSPDLPGLVQKGSSVLPPGVVEWEAQAGSASTTTAGSSRKIRFRLSSIGIGGSATTRFADVESTRAEGVFSARGFSVVSVVQGRWFSSSVINRFAKGPFKKNMAGGSDPWWGPGGRFSLYPRSFVVLGQPSFSLQLDADSYRRIKEAVKGGATVKVGPFWMEPTRKGDEFSFDDKRSTITAKRPDQAVVVAVINQLNNWP